MPTQSDLVRKSWAFSWRSQGRADKTLSEMERHLGRFAAFLAADDRDLLTATRYDCEAYLASIESQPSRNYAWRALRSFYGFLAEEGETPSIMVRVKAPKVELRPVSTASEDDYAALMRACAGRSATDIRDAALISIFWSTGMRRSEVARLTVSDIDLDNMILVVQRSKSGRSRVVPFDSKTGQMLMRWLTKRERWVGAEETDALWLGKKGAMTADGVRQAVERRRTEAGVIVSCHSFRRGLAARALRNGVSGPSTSAILGWSPSSVMLGRYLRGVQAELACEEYRNRLG